MSERLLSSTIRLTQYASAGAVGCLLLLVPASAVFAAPQDEAPASNAAASSDPTASNAPLDPKTVDLIQQLGAASFAVRQRATRELQALGIAAKPALVLALQSKDAEIRSRARTILVEVLNVDFRRRIAEFAADRTGDESHDLPGWRMFQKSIGSDSLARRVFLEAIRAEPILLESIEQSSDYASSTLNSRSTNLYNRYIRNPMYRGIVEPGQAGEANVAALLIAAMNPHLPLDEYVATKIYQLVQHAGLRQQLQSGTRQEPVRRLVGSFIRRTADSPLAYQTIWLAMHHDLKDGVVPAEAIIERRDRQPYMLQNAILCIGKLGDRRHIALLEPLLDDVTPVDGRISNAVRPQVCDAALAVSIHLAGRDPKDFGFTKLQVNDQTLYQSNTLAFDSETQREQALAHWRQWWANHSAAAPKLSNQE
jgi:hypothetical protein